MQKYQKPKFTEDQLGLNPLADRLIIPVKRLTMPGQFVRDDETLVENVAVLESDSVTKIFTSPEKRMLHAGLPPRGSHLLDWVRFEVEPGKDYLWINRQRYMEESGVSINTYKEAVKSLVRYNFIAYTVVTDVYWINPDFFFKGNRLKKYPNNLKSTDK